MQCPECKQEIHNAPYCGCGWKRKSAEGQPEVTHIQCAHDGCMYNSRVRIRTETGWATLCDAHYSQHYLDSAKKYCASLGLFTTEQKRQWVREKARMLGNKMRPDYLREPGEDEDYQHPTS